MRALRVVPRRAGGASDMMLLVAVIGFAAGFAVGVAGMLLLGWLYDEKQP